VGVIVAYNTEHPTQDTTMTRKLHNTLMAVIASSSLLIVGLIAGAPVVPKLEADNSTNVLASIAADAEALADNVEEPSTLPARRTRGERHSRQALAMPFFSFAPRG
ncbi:MAG: hypothetical protein ABIQ62_08230, partial [Thermomonas sp.]